MTNSPGIKVASTADQFVQVYAWRLPAALADEPGCRAVLQSEEVDRADRFRYPQHRIAYLASHLVLKGLLAALCDTQAAQIRLEDNAFGKPFVASPRTGIRFNMSHTEGWCAIAISQEAEVGIDIERIRPIEREVAEGHFSTSELAQLALLAPEGWLAGFYRCWTSKEALLKAEGFGLGIPLDSFDVEAAPDRPPELIAARPEAGFTRHWKLHPLALEPGIAGIVATHSTATISYCELDDRVFL